MIYGPYTPASGSSHIDKIEIEVLPILGFPATRKYNMRLHIYNGCSLHTYPNPLTNITGTSGIGTGDIITYGIPTTTTYVSTVYLGDGPAAGITVDIDFCEFLSQPLSVTSLPGLYSSKMSDGTKHEVPKKRKNLNYSQAQGFPKLVEKLMAWLKRIFN